MSNSSPVSVCSLPAGFIILLPPIVCFAAFIASCLLCHCSTPTPLQHPRMPLAGGKVLGVSQLFWICSVLIIKIFWLLKLWCKTILCSAAAQTENNIQFTFTNNLTDFQCPSVCLCLFSLSVSFCFSLSVFLSLLTPAQSRQMCL